MSEGRIFRLVTLFRVVACGVVLAFGGPGIGQADGLRVSPVTLEVSAPGATTTLTLRNDSRQTITVQARVLRWKQDGGNESFSRTSDVVVSPPMTRLAPGAQQTVRVVRTSRAPVRGEEAYRVFIDEVPDQTRRRAGTVAFATRLRIPVFFVEPGAKLPDVRWSIRRSGDRAVLEARNVGQVRLRLADLRINSAGTTVVRHNGLFGYVLGGSTMRWTLGSASRYGGGVTLQATTSRGPLNANVSAQ